MKGSFLVAAVLVTDALNDILQVAIRIQIDEFCIQK